MSKRIVRLGGVVALGVVAASAFLTQTLNRHSETPPQARRPKIPRFPSQATVVTEENRKVFPYSVVPGGAKTLNEAKRAMRDPAVKDHYAAIDLKNLKQVTLTADLYGYVSYRFGDKIYWTAKQLRLKAGETVYTDGQHIVRGRCLNCYSAHPMLPIRKNEPSEAILNTPVEVPMIALSFPRLPPEEAPTLPPPLEELTPEVPVLPGAPGAPGHGGIGFFPIIPIIPPIHRHRPHPAPVPIVPVVPPVTVVTPEPNYVWVMAGVSVILAFLKLIRSGRQKRFHC
ncbi:MAG TPA: hypothetical protein VEV17_01110 [Bryobacteraceae bacterium]|nr:hypothetical protein [Bryobacteraceae bacterium]